MPLAPEILEANEHLIKQAMLGHPLFDLHRQPTINISQHIVFAMEHLIAATATRIPSWEMFKYTKPDFETHLKNMRSALLRQTSTRPSMLAYFDGRLELIYEALSQKKPIEEIIQRAQKDSDIRYARRNVRLSKYDLQGLNGLPRGQRVSPLLPKHG